MNTHYTFNDVSLLITHYNRSGSLERLLSAFSQLHCSFGGIIVSDDASKPEHLNAVKKLQNEYNFTLVSAEKNGGLGNNINKGQDAVTTPYTLYVQEDFMPTENFAPNFETALAAMKQRDELDIVRFYAYFKYPYLQPSVNGFSEMKFKSWYPGYMKFYCYSDHPHLRRSSFFNKFGRYAEGVNGDQTEYRMCIAFIRGKGKGLFYNDFTQLFLQVNTSSEPSTANFRKKWRTLENPVVLALRAIYLQYKFVKFHYDLMFMH